MARANTYSKAQHQRLVKSVNYLTNHINRKQKFVEDFGQLYFPKNYTKRKRELKKIAAALEVLAQANFEQIR